MDEKEQQVEQFKRGIFALRTNFGELAQLMIKQKFKLTDSGVVEYDLIDPAKTGNDSHIEVKFSRAYKNESSITLKNAIELCSNSSIDVFAYDEWNDSDLFCNIQQIKPELFRTLYYGIFWKDKIEVFCIDNSKHHLFPDTIEHFTENATYRNQIRKAIPYFYLQHNKKDYQFHLKKGSLPTHRKSYLKCMISYEELFDLLSPKK